MKRLVLFLFLLVATSSIAQLIKIHVTEVQSYYGNNTQTVTEVIADPWMTETSPRKVNSLWVLDLTNNHLSKFINNELVYNAPIIVTRINQLVRIEIVEPNFNTGLLIETTNRESVTWYYFYDDLVEYQKWITFDIIKTY